MAKSYRHLTYDQRCQIYSLKERGDCAAIIARYLQVHRSTIIRELRRNQTEKGYHYQSAHIQATSRRNSSQRKTSPITLALVEEKIKSKWSPEQISGWLKKQKLPSVSYETIYQYIWTDKKQGGDLYKNLRHRGKKYNKRSKGTSGRGCIPGRVDIKERPSIVEKKERLGDWELDTIIGANHKGAIVSMVDRASKFTKLVKIPFKTASEVENAIVKALGFSKESLHTLTSDNGKEFARHQNISTILQADFYFATPYHSWERGLNEHTNGLVRQYFPKRLGFDKITDLEVKAVEEALNSRPRKILCYETPLEAFTRLSTSAK